MNDLPALRLFLSECRWAMRRETLSALYTAVREATSLDDVQTVRDALGPSLAASTAMSTLRGRAGDGSIGVLPIMGTITSRPSIFSWYFGGVTIVELQIELRRLLADPDVRTIVLLVDSPGGTTDLLFEFAAELDVARRIKPIVAVASTMMASAAFWLGAQADRLYVTPSGAVGSVGVYCMHTDYSRALDKAGIAIEFISAGTGKVDGNEFEPLPDRARTRFQREIDSVYDQFVGAVARGRGVPAARVVKEWQAFTWNASDAVRLGLADGIATFEETVARSSQYEARLRADEDQCSLTLALLGSDERVLTGEEQLQRDEDAIAVALALVGADAADGQQQAQQQADADAIAITLALSE